MRHRVAGVTPPGIPRDAGAVGPHPPHAAPLALGVLLATRPRRHPADALTALTPLADPAPNTEDAT